MYLDLKTAAPIRYCMRLHQKNSSLYIEGSFYLTSDSTLEHVLDYFE